MFETPSSVGVARPAAAPPPLAQTVRRHKVLRWVYGPKGEEESGGWKKTRREEPHMSI
jgi:hypothetical protein